LRAHILPVSENIYHSQFVQLDTFGYFIKVFKTNVLQQKHTLKVKTFVTLREAAMPLRDA
jgi:hypothetical protein